MTHRSMERQSSPASVAAPTLSIRATTADTVAADGSSRTAPWIDALLSSQAPRATLLIRLVVGAVFLSEGLLKFISPEELGVGRFVKIGIPLPGFSAPFVGVFEIACGALLLLGLVTRLATVPMIVDMLVAIATTKIPLLVHEGFWKMVHEARVDYSMLLGCVFLLLVGAGRWSLDARISRKRDLTSERRRDAVGMRR
jgi:putative oxidoreductase